MFINNFENLSVEEIEVIKNRLILEYYSRWDEKSRKLPPYWLEELVEKVEKALKEKKKKKENN